MDMETWHGDIETWIWRRGNGYMDMKTWTWRHGHEDVDMVTWAWRHGIKKVKTENGSPGNFP
jgi:hypothetical protein